MIGKDISFKYGGGGPDKERRQVNLLVWFQRKRSGKELRELRKIMTRGRTNVSWEGGESCGGKRRVPVALSSRSGGEERIR